MISIVICSINQSALSRVKVNIRETIGVPYEIITINNSGSADGICKVYNRGGERAAFPIICFIHEDILFETMDWGLAIIAHFTDRKIGLLGVAGGDSKSLVPSSWSTSFKSNEVNLVQHYKRGDQASRHIFMTENGVPQSRKRVAALDGLFLCTRKEIFDRIKFDEINLKGFHGYDIDYSLQVLMSYEVVVVFDILISHYSEGQPDREWLKNAVIISKKWKKRLPVSVHALSKAEFNFYHWKSLQVFLENLFRLNYRYHQIVFYYLSYSFTRFFTIRRFLSMGKYVIQSIYEKSFKARRETFSNYKVDEMKLSN